ncbi:MAG: type I-E CRISPR-associated protein Cas5/CasD [Deltaproteobacteria bacterium]|nr:type I-E CRISPR-associated protein Cas5/CasD [Deltaproteobacteria bacterium]
MSTDKSYLALRLEGPLQSWGFDSQYNRRNTGLMPTKSAIAGMCCAALGWSRGSGEERKFLLSFGELKMTAIAIPRRGVKKNLPAQRLEDYHTVGGGYGPNDLAERRSITVSAEDGKPRAKNGQALAVLTRRQYLTDASFGVLLEGDGALLREVALALSDPKWGIWLGRKTCIPTAPVLAGLMNSYDDAIRLIVGDKPLAAFMRQEDAASFSDGLDSIPDMAVSFDPAHRMFVPRRVTTVQAS